jgi:hypothetical protein
VRRRLLGCLTVAATTLLTSVLAVGVAGNASAVVGVSLTGAAPATAIGPSSVLFRYTVSTPDDLTAVTMQTHQDALLPADPASVTLDGVAVPAADVTSAGNDLTIATATLATGDHVIAYQATVPTGAASTSSTATVSYTDAANPGGQPVTSAPVAIIINQPDLALQTTAFSGLLGTGDPATLRLGTLSEGMIEADVVNHGATSGSNSLLIDLPAGAVFEDALPLGSNSANCALVAADPHQLSCAVGALAHNGTASVLILLTTEDAPPVGTSGIATITAQIDDTTLTDGTPSDNSTNTTIQFIGAAHLSYSMTATATKVTVGGKLTLTLTVHNSGPQDAPNAIALVAIENNTFQIVNFDGKQLSLPGVSGAGFGNSAGATIKAARSSLQRAAAQSAPTHRKLALDARAGSASPTASAPASGPDTSDGRLWDLGTLASGQSATAHLTLQAKRVGTMKFAFMAISDAGDPTCAAAQSDQDAIALGCLKELSLTSVAVKAVTPISKVGESGASNGGGVLASTGSSPTAPAVLAVGLLLAGGLALRIGRRRG